LSNDVSLIFYHIPVRGCLLYFFFFQAEDGIRDTSVTGVQTCALPICGEGGGGTGCETFAELYFGDGDESAGRDGTGGVEVERVPETARAGDGGSAGLGADERVRGHGVR